MEETLNPRPQQAEPVYAIKPPVNRSERRKTFEELARNTQRLKLIDVEFLTELFDEHNNKSYEELYTEYLDKYADEFAFMKSKKMFKHTLPNYKYFSQIYRPQK